MHLHLCLIFLGTHILLLEVAAEIELPSGMSISQYCQGCISTIKELSKKVDKKVEQKFESRESVVMDELENICTAQNFVNYEYSPPRTVKACKLLIEKHEEEIETAFAKGKENLEDLICNKISKACDGVDRTTKPKDYGDIDLTTNENQQKVEKVISVDPETGEAVVDKKDDEKKESEGKPESSNKANSEPEKVKRKKKETLKQSEEAGAKTLSKKSKKDKKIKKKEKKIEKKVKKPDNAYGADNMFNIDINDPGSMERVMAQIKQVAQEHSANHYKKQEEEEDRLEAEAEKSTEKDEL